MLFIIDQCPLLRHIWGLDLLMLSPQSITAIQQHITKNNRHIDLHDGMSTSDDSSTKGIPFLSERSKRRVEVAYQAIDDDHADQIAQVGERAFEEILREVSLI